MDFLKKLDTKTTATKEYNDKEFSACDIKLIILGDSAVGKSKYTIFESLKHIL